MRYTNLLIDNPMNNAALQMDAGLRAQGGQALAVQNFCTALINQPFIDFGDLARLQEIQTKINNGLEKAKGHANYYLGTLQPEIIMNTSNIGNYYNLYSSVPVILPEGSSNEQWINLLKTLEKQSSEYSGLAKRTADKIGAYYVQLGDDSATFQGNVNELNSIVDGNEGVLKDLEKQLADIDGELTGVIVGITASGLAIVGGIFLVAVGSIGSFVTAGTSAPLAVAGGVLIVAGVAGSVGFGIALANLLDAKSNILQTQVKLKGEVRAIQGISSSYNQLLGQAGEAQKAANEMKNAWEFLSSDLGVLSYDLQQGIVSGDDVRKLWLTAANEAVQTVKEDITLIKGQLLGVTTATAPNNESLATFVRNQGRSKSSLDFPEAFSYWRAN